MDNLPPGISQWMLDDNHLSECEDQPAKAECICLDIKLAKADAQANNYETV